MNQIKQIGTEEVKKYMIHPQYCNYKGQQGKPLLIVGSTQYHGAAILCSQASLIAGNDYVYVLTHGSKFQIISQSSPCILTTAYEDKQNIVNQYQKINISSIVIGCGLDRSQESFKMIQQTIQLQNIKNIPLVIDADGIFLLAQNYNNQQIQLNKQILLTPNSREFCILYQQVFQKEPNNYIEEFKNFKIDGNKITYTIKHSLKEINDLAIKNVIDIVSDGKNIYYTQSYGQPKRSSGQGDVLAGLLSCFLNQHDNICERACAASQLCKLGAKQAYDENGICLSAQDVIQGIKNIIKQLYQKEEKELIFEFQL